MIHSFNIEFAERYGIEGAIIIEQLYWWLHKNACESDMIKEDRVWCYFSARGLANYIPYMNSQKLRRELKKLEDLEVLMVGNFNKSPINQTLWYSFTDKFLPELNDAGYDTSDFSKMKNGFFKNEKCNKTIINNNLIEDNIIEENRLSNDNQKTVDELFETFWNLYDYKKGKGKAYNAWKRLKKSEKEQAIKCIPEYKDDCRKNERRMKHPATFLNQKTWEDDFTCDGMVKANEEQNEPDAKWGKTKEWLDNNVPMISNGVNPIDFAIMKTMVESPTQLAKILKEINDTCPDGDIMHEFKRILYEQAG